MNTSFEWIGRTPRGGGLEDCPHVPVDASDEHDPIVGRCKATLLRSWRSAGETPELDTDSMSLDTLAMDKPNVLVFICDDIGFNDIGRYQGRGMPDRDVYQGERVHTPNIDSIASQGALLTRYYATSAICTPSRYSVLTGRYASRSPSVIEGFPAGSPATITWNTRIDRTESNMAKVFKSMGYATGFVGKWHNSTPANFKSIKHGPEEPVNEPFLAEVRAAYKRGVKHLRNGFGFDHVDRLYDGNREGFPHPFQVHNLEWIAEGAIEFMEASKGRPFFLYMATSAPHGDYFTDFTAVDPCYTPAGILEERPKAMPPREALLDRVREAGRSEKTAMSTWIDECLGAALGKLEELGVLEDTIVVFTCDHLARGKYMCYEGARVPFMIRWPGRIEPGMELSKICANIDLVATLSDLAGGSLPEGYESDGMSFAPLLLEPGVEHRWREHLMLEVSNIRGIVTDRWKYIANRASYEVLEAIEADRREAEAAGRKRWVAWEGRRNPHAGYELEGVRYFAAGEFPCYFDPDQLYDLQSDVFEQSNLYSDPQHAELVGDLKRRLGQELRRLPHSFGEFTPPATSGL